MKFYFSIHIKAVLLLAGVFSAACISAQNVHSTYSRFGIGLLEAPGSVTHFGMGGVTTPITDGSLINFSNPATYSFCGVTTMQVTGKGSMLNARTNTQSDRYTGGQVNEMGILFKKPGSKWAFAAGLMPYSHVGYILNSSQSLNDSITASYKYTGTGGLNKLTVGTSRAFVVYVQQKQADSLGVRDTTYKFPLHQISVGVNVNYLFGSIERTNTVEFGNATFYNTKENTRLFNQGFVMEAGLLYKVRLKKVEEDRRVVGETHLYAGIDYNLQSNIRSIMNDVNTTYIYNSGVPVEAATTHTGEELRGKMTIPQRLSVGAALRKNHKKWGRYTLAVDYKMQDWGSYKVSFDNPFAQSAYLDKASTISLGIEYEPSLARSDNFLHKMNYRAGARNTNTHINVAGTAISQQAVSAGISIPVVRSMSRLHLGAEYVTQGTLDNNLIMEKGVNFMIGFTLTPAERWFFQRKYD